MLLEKEKILNTEVENFTFKETRRMVYFTQNLTSALELSPREIHHLFKFVYVKNKKGKQDGYMFGFHYQIVLSRNKNEIKLITNPDSLDKFEPEYTFDQIEIPYPEVEKYYIPDEEYRKIHRRLLLQKSV